MFANTEPQTFVSPHRESQRTLSSYLFMEIKSDMSMYACMKVRCEAIPKMVISSIPDSRPCWCDECNKETGKLSMASQLASAWMNSHCYQLENTFVDILTECFRIQKLPVNWDRRLEILGYWTTVMRRQEGRSNSCWPLTSNDVYLCTFSSAWL